VFGDNNEHKKYVATKSGFLHAESSLQNLSRSKKSESKQKRDKMQVDILPYNSNKYYPQENDTVIGIVTSKNMDFYQLDIGGEAYAALGT
jgi:exosome complex RNA-binding protein Rrp4|tara:strand:- start:171 stop:440 length:270 start_codon:yes stop_codon:yes gene_type:complete